MEHKFKEGDKVKIRYDCSSSIEGETAILKLDKDGELHAIGKASIGCSCRDNWIFISSKTPFGIWA